MPDLYHTLLRYDIGHLRIIADLWGLEIKAREIDPAAEELCASLMDPRAVQDTIDILPAEARTALEELVTAGGKIEGAVFARRFGEIRDMGAGRRERETPHLKPGSAAEILFYRGLMARAFFDLDKGAQEYAYIPDDLLELIRHAGHEERKEKQAQLGRAATPVERSFELPGSDHVLDDATTLLAALRMGRSDFKPNPRVYGLLSAAKIVRKNTPQAEAVKRFLAASRTEALGVLYNAWLDSQGFDELRLIPELICEGEWKNSPRETRHMILSLLDVLPREKWWSLRAFLNDLKAKRPDFQRPAGDYDSWFIKRPSDGKYLRGFAHWDQVDGAVVKAIIQMLHLLGRADLAGPEENGELTAFRPRTFQGNTLENGKLGAASNGTITVTRLFPRAVRYQLARFCEWDLGKPDEHKYHISARSLQRANEQGLKARQLLSLLAKHTNNNVPPALVKALKRWEANGAEARVESLSVLRVNKPEVITELRRSKAGKFLGERLSPTAVVVKAGAIPKVMAALAELGRLAETEIHE